MRPFFKGFAYAAKGVARVLLGERNFRFHLCVAAYVYVFSLFYSLSAAQYALLTVIVAGVLALEMLNTAIEYMVDGFTKDKSPVAAAVKDISAGAVLVFCVGAVACGLFLFWRVATFRAIFAWFAAHPLMIVLLALSLALCFWFVFIFGNNKGKTDE